MNSIVPRKGQGRNERIFKPRTYKGRQLGQIAFPLGGIGTGNVSLGGRGNLQDWELFNRPSKGLTLQNTFFAIWAKAEGKSADCRVLEAEHMPPYQGAFGHSLGAAPGLPRFRSAAFSGSYPFARVALGDPEFPLEAKLEAFSPFIPLRDMDSGLPAAIFLWTVTNKGRRRVDASIAASLLNPIGLDGSERMVARRQSAFGGNVNELVHEQHMWAIRMSSRRYEEGDVRFGTVSFGMLWPKVSAVTRWPKTGGWDWWDLMAFWNDFSEDGALKGPIDAVPSEIGESDTGTLCALLNVEPGESLTVPVVLTWHFPNRVNDWNSEAGVRGKIIRNYYTTCFKDAPAVMKYLVQDFERLGSESRKFEQAFTSSSFPPAVIESVGNQLATVRSGTFFRDEDGRMLGFEGCGDRHGCCPLNCTHVFNYAQTYAYLFPELERGMREIDFLHNTRPGGNMAFRTLAPLPAEVLWEHAPAADGQMGCVVRAYREWQLSGDAEFLKRLWPKIREALEFAWKEWDADRDGLMEGCQHNTYDVEFYGPNPLTGFIYLAALKAGSEMAAAVGESDAAAEFGRVFESGSRRIAEKLWNGEYFQQTGSGEQPSQFLSGCLSDQLLGQWMAHLLGFGYLTREDLVKKALEAVFKHNFRTSLRKHVNTERIYAIGADPGLLICTWPRGGRPAAPVPYADEVWTGVEYQVAAHLIYEGKLTEAMKIIEAVRTRHDGERRNPYNEPECGDHYARGLASWSLILALSGFRWSAPEGTLRFVSAFPQKKFSSFYSTGTAWGTITEGKSGRHSLVSIKVSDGSLKLMRLRLSPSLKSLGRCWLEPSRTFLRGRMEKVRGETVVEFGSSVEVGRGQALVLSFDN